jgi:hypothetical protein
MIAAHAGRSDEDKEVTKQRKSASGKVAHARRNDEEKERKAQRQSARMIAAHARKGNKRQRECVQVRMQSPEC